MLEENQVNITKEMDEPFVRKNAYLKPITENEHDTFFYHDYEFIRFGVPTGGSSFFYCLHSWKKDFRDLSRDAQVDFIREFRKQIGEKEDSHLLFQDVNFLIQFIEMYKMTLLMFDTNDEGMENTGFNLEIVKILFQLVPLEIVESEVIPCFESSILQMENVNELDYIEYIDTIFKKYISLKIASLEENVSQKWETDMREKIIYMLLESVSQITNHVLNEVKNKYKNDLKNYDCYLSLEQIENLNFDVNVFIIDASRQRPCDSFCNKEYNENKHCIILLYFPDHHYEILAKQKTVNGQKRIFRLFNFRDEEIQKIVKYYE